jgi:hypothetical protein
MKYLCLAFVIGWSGAAYAATGTSPPVNVPITISSSAPTPPTEAANAGFTTLAANYDFSQPLYATQSNWLDCNNTNNSLIWHIGSPGFGATLPCNINQVTDPVSGLKVLDMQYLNSYFATYGLTGNENFVSMQTVSKGGVNQGGTLTASYPNGYIEASYRLDTTAAVNPPLPGPDGVWTWIAGGHALASSNEFDIAELYGSGAADASGQGQGAVWATWNFGCANNPGCTSRLPAGYGTTTYHRYGVLFTSNGTNSTYLCSFIDGVFQACNFTTDPFTERNWLIAWVGSTGGGTIDTNLYMQYIRVWSCSSWSAGNCYGSTLVGSGNVSDTTLSYWH